MVNQYLSIYLVAFYSKVTSVISNNHKITNGLPFHRTIKNLIQISVKPKSVCTDNSAQTKILISLFESL